MNEATVPQAAVPLDTKIGHTRPIIDSAAALEDFEAVSYQQRIAATNTYDALRIGASILPDAPAIEFLVNADPADTPLTISHRQFFERVTQAANLFTELGVGPDDVVSLLLPLVPQSFYALFGAQAAGIANPVNPLLEPHQLLEILNAAGTRVLVVLGPIPDTDIWAKVEQIRGQLPHLKTILFVGGDLAEKPGLLNFDQALARHAGDKLACQRRFKDSDTAAYFHTGGTTGTPKLVRHSHRNQVYQAWGMSLFAPAVDQDKLLFGLPLFHVGGALTQALAMLTSGGSLVVLSASGWRNANGIKNVWRLVEKYRPSSLSGVPTVLTAAASVPIAGADVSSLARSAGGGSAIPVAVGRTLQEKLGQPVIEVYGMTETASVHTQAYPDRPLRLGSAGHPLPYSRTRIVKLNEAGQWIGDCKPDEIGVIAMSGPGVFSGYLNAEHNQGAFIEPGWVNSGDLGRLDEQGYLWITGRAKDLVIRGGHNIDPAGVEEVLYQHPDVALPAVIGQPDAHAGELPLAYVQLKPGATVTEQELLAHVRKYTPERAAVPVDIVFIETMPLTGVGKVFKPELRRRATERVFAEVLAPLTANGAQIDIAVRAHGTHGSLAELTVVTPDQDKKESLEQSIGQALAPFVMAHKIVWRN